MSEVPGAAVTAGIAFSDLRIEIAGRDFGPEAIVGFLVLAGVLTFGVFSFLRREERPYDQLAELRGKEPER